MNPQWVFIDRDGRMRSGWRFTVFAVGFIFLSALLTAGVSIAMPKDLSNEAAGSAIYFLIFNLATLIPALIVGWLCNRYLDGRPFISLGISFSGNWFGHLAIGLLVGGLTLCFGVLVAVVFGGLTFSPDQVSWDQIGRTLALSLFVFAVAAASEEVLCRGYPLQTFFHSNLKIFGIIFTALIFASGHLGNPNVNALSWINTFLAGIWFATAYWRTRDLWFPIGIHLMWNWMQGAFFGIEVSGLTDVTSSPLLREIDRGPAWLTGENYGIEAGISCTIALIVSTAAIYFWPGKTKQPES